MKKYLLGSLLIVIVLLGLFGKSTLFRFLSPTERVDTDLLVIEAWTDREGLEQAVAEINNFGYQRIIVTSLAYPFDSTHAYEVASEGGLTFNFAESPVSDDTITVYAASVSLRDIPAHFRLWVNDSLVGEAWTKEALAPYAFALPDTSTLRRVTVEFDNDGFEEGIGDRNLLVQSVRTGGQTFYARMPNVRYDRGRIDGQKLERTDARSEADETANFLRRQGVPDSMLISVAAPVTDYNKTYASARAAQEWLARQPEADAVIAQCLWRKRPRPAQSPAVPQSLRSVGPHRGDCRSQRTHPGGQLVEESPGGLLYAGTSGQVPVRSPVLLARYAGLV